MEDNWSMPSSGASCHVSSFYLTGNKPLMPRKFLRFLMCEGLWSILFSKFSTYCRFCGGVEVLLNLLMSLVSVLNLSAGQVSRDGRSVSSLINSFLELSNLNI